MTSIVSENDVQAANAKARHLESRLNDLKASCAGLKRDLLKTTTIQKFFNTAVWSRQVCDRYHLWRGGVLVVVPAAIAAISFVAIHVLSRHMPTAVTGATISTLITLGALTALLLVPSALTINEKQRSLNIHETALRAEIGQLQEQITALKSKFERTKKAADEVNERWLRQKRSESLEYQCSQLYRRNWRAMRSVEFEQYLEEVFVVLGYSVDQTKVTGDQGVDLVVVKNGFRIAIQVKGYASSVGNSAVQQAYAGMAHYGCQGCAAITNSRFTTGAEGLAESTNCVLIHEDKFRDFVYGKFDLVNYLMATDS